MLTKDVKRKRLEKMLKEKDLKLEAIVKYIREDFIIVCNSFTNSKELVLLKNKFKRLNVSYSRVKKSYLKNFFKDNEHFEGVITLLTFKMENSVKDILLKLKLIEGEMSLVPLIILYKGKYISLPVLKKLLMSNKFSDNFNDLIIKTLINNSINALKVVNKNNIVLLNLIEKKKEK